MKKYAWIVGVIIIFGLAFYCSNMKKKVDAEQQKIEKLCRRSASNALEEFEEYVKTGEECYYQYGVGEFRCFIQSYQYMKDDVDTEYLYCNEAYGQMVLNSEKVKENMPKLIDALQYLAKDYSDANGYHRMQSFNNSVMYEDLE